MKKPKATIAVDLEHHCRQFAEACLLSAQWELVKSRHSSAPENRHLTAAVTYLDCAASVTKALANNSLKAMQKSLDIALGLLDNHYTYDSVRYPLREASRTAGIYQIQVHVDKAPKTFFLNETHELSRGSKKERRKK